MATIQHQYVPVKTGFADNAKQAQEVELYGGFNPLTKKMTPFSCEPYSVNNMPMLSDMMDSIAAAVEAGVIDSEQWPAQIFASNSIMESFFQALANYDDCYRIVDYWWQALAALRGHLEEEEAVRGVDLANSLIDYISELEGDGVEFAWTA